MDVRNPFKRPESVEYLDLSHLAHLDYSEHVVIEISKMLMKRMTIIQNMPDKESENYEIKKFTN